MILRRFDDEALAQASYLVGCQAAGEALVIDPARDVDQYAAAAAAAGLRIAAVTETHIHADFVSGSRELAARTGAALYLSDEGGPGWRYAYAAEVGATLLREGDEIRVGGLRVRALHTPGHTPEHLSFLLTDTAATDRPMGVFTGDFVFVGDVGRPDLLERAAGVVGGAEAGARRLFRSLQRFKALPDYLQIWPGHGAGSACGRGLSALPQSTVGFERLANWAFAIEDEERFVRAVLTGQPEAPRYFAEMKRVNRDGPPPLAGLHAPQTLADARVVDLVSGGELVVDTRPADAFAAAHVPGTINVPLDGGFVTWAGSLLPYDRRLYLLVGGGRPEDVERAVRGLRSIGLDRVAGVLGGGAVSAWAVAGGRTGALRQVAPTELARLGDALVLDVRSAAEWATGHLPGARHVPLGALPDRLRELPGDRLVVACCRSGARSAIAASLLRATGVPEVANLRGGVDAWRAARLPLVDDPAAPASGAARHPARPKEDAHGNASGDHRRDVRGRDRGADRGGRARGPRPGVRSQGAADRGARAVPAGGGDAVTAPIRTYGFGTIVAAPYAEAIDRAKAGLKEQGFGVLTEIDVRKTLKEKLGAEFRPYVILGVCNPSLAHRALSADLGIGLLLPCNVVVYDNGDGSSTVEAMDPEAALGIVGGDPAIAAVAREARTKLRAAVERLGQPS